MMNNRSWLVTNVPSQLRASMDQMPNGCPLPILHGTGIYLIRKELVEKGVNVICPRDPNDPSTFSEGDWRRCYVGLEGPVVPTEKVLGSLGMGRVKVRRWLWRIS